MKKLILIFTSILFLALVAVVPALWHKSKFETKPRSFYLDNKDPDTLKFNEIFKGAIELNKKEITKPNHVLEFLPDTTTRKEVEKTSIITKVSLFNPLFKPKKLIVNKIDTKGVVFESVYKIPFASTFVIDHDGDVRVKKYRGWKILGGIVALSLTSYLGCRAAGVKISLPLFK